MSHKTYIRNIIYSNNRGIYSAPKLTESRKYIAGKQKQPKWRPKHKNSASTTDCHTDCQHFGHLPIDSDLPWWPSLQCPLVKQFWIIVQTLKYVKCVKFVALWIQPLYSLHLVAFHFVLINHKHITHEWGARTRSQDPNNRGFENENVSDAHRRTDVRN